VRKRRWRQEGGRKASDEGQRRRGRLPGWSGGAEVKKRCVEEGGQGVAVRAVLCCACSAQSNHYYCRRPLLQIQANPTTHQRSRICTSLLLLPQRATPTSSTAEQAPAAQPLEAHHLLQRRVAVRDVGVDVEQGQRRRVVAVPGGLEEVEGLQELGVKLLQVFGLKMGVG